MIDRKAALLRVITCAVGGAVFLSAVAILRSYMPIEPGHYVPGFRAHVLGYTSVFDPVGAPRPFSGIVGVGALLGLLPGIAWAIDQKSARRRFLVWSIMGAVIGFVLSMASNRAEPMIVFAVAGVYVGVVSALKRLGMYKVQEDSQAAEGNELSGNRE